MDIASPMGRVSAWLETFGQALESGDTEALKSLFAEECYWRDLVSFTWNIKTMEGRDAIADMASATLGDVHPTSWKIDGEPSEGGGITEAWITFETDAVHGRGHVRLNDDGCWTLLTTAQELKGFEEKKGDRRDQGVAHGAFKDRETWAERREREAKELGYADQPYVVIIGGGQGGIGLGARLRRLGVPTIIVEKNERPGDSWRKRYKSLCLHDPVWYDH
ncbi:MAG: NAD(P)/FAD-dependent oxidoreductase, partial [Pseudomonadota bacterium]